LAVRPYRIVRSSTSNRPFVRIESPVRPYRIARSSVLNCPFPVSKSAGRRERIGQAWQRFQSLRRALSGGHGFFRSSPARSSAAEWQAIQFLDVRNPASLDSAAAPFLHQVLNLLAGSRQPIRHNAKEGVKTKRAKVGRGR
jgi:hypothetical protein